LCTPPFSFLPPYNSPASFFPGIQGLIIPDPVLSGNGTIPPFHAALFERRHLHSFHHSLLFPFPCFLCGFFFLHLPNGPNFFSSGLLVFYTMQVHRILDSSPFSHLPIVYSSFFSISVFSFHLKAGFPSWTFRPSLCYRPCAGPPPLPSKPSTSGIPCPGRPLRGQRYSFSSRRSLILKTSPQCRQLILALTPRGKLGTIFSLQVCFLVSLSLVFTFLL